MKNSSSIHQYAIVTGNYWAFTLTDGALRMLVVLYFYQLNYTPLQIASLFLFYEFFGVITNLLGGYFGARLGLNRTMNIGLFLQIIALMMLTLPAAYLSIPLVMLAQAISGIAKDLNKMSAKSAIKLLVPEDENARLFRWIALLTGSKNALKGVGFFLGGLLLTLLGFQQAILSMAIVLALVWIASLFLLSHDLGKAKNKPKFHDLFSKSTSINLLSAARLCLFAARDVWFVVALPVFLSSRFQWSFWQTSGFLASWVIGYGIIQTISPYVVGKTPNGKTALLLAIALTLVTGILALSMNTFTLSSLLITGLIIFGILFAFNSSVHSFLIVHYAKSDGVSLDVGFYYMANAMGRLLGTVLSGWVYQQWGMAACLWCSTILIASASVISIRLSKT
ncbi:MAG: organoarsenical effux MFS transporter ArsJ [Cellvibrio sp.]|nr:organoarsenical effux MFS transporter ArsJ [Cellvibrio sp.]